MDYLESKEPDDEKHVHPLQLDVIERCLALYSNPGEVVLSPFMGVGSEICAAIANERKGIGIELKSSYYRQSARNLEFTAKNGLQLTSSRSLIQEDENEETTQDLLLPDTSKDRWFQAQALEDSQENVIGGRFFEIDRPNET